MSQETIHKSMPEEDRAKFERGKELLGQVQEGKLFDDWWVPIGAGLHAVRRAVLTALHLKTAKGGLYKNGFTNAVAKTPYADMKPVVRSNLLLCMEHIADIMEMRSTFLTPTERIEVNHPTSMVKHLKRYLDRNKDKDASAKERKNSSARALLLEKEEKVKELTKANEGLFALVETLKQSDGDPGYDLFETPPEQIAEVIVGNLSTRQGGRARAKAIGEKILAKVKQLPTKKQPAEKPAGEQAG